MNRWHPGWCWAVLCGLSFAHAGEPASSAWPEVSQTAKPWTRWWWPGSAVEPAQLTTQLRAFADAGLGGVEITPIYGARGAEAQYLEYLSPRWVEMLGHVTREAGKLGLGVDMATGTGWPFGGPQVLPAEGSSSLLWKDGLLTGKPTGMLVKRAAPGGEGLVLDPYSLPALDNYLLRFSRALAPLPRGAVRSQFHDSFEYFNASWSPGLPQAFTALNGYDIQSFAAALSGNQPLDADTLGRIKGDYRRTLGQLHLDYLRRWVGWSHEQGFRARNQAHGAPANLLDLYAASDIPETESFGATRFPIPGLRQDAVDINEDPDPPINLVGRFASSAAHVMGKPLVSSETLTWLRENFRESPAAAKPQLDRLFIAGINHIFYHGATYSPAEAAWPGWFFYAATQLNPTNPLWQDYAAMHAYVTRVQSVLQQGRPDNTLLFYWPQADLDDSPEGLMRQYGMHENQWLKDSPAGRLARQLLEAGYSFDFVSDAQLLQLRAQGGRLLSPGGGRYEAILIPRTRRMPVDTLRALAALSRDASVVYEALPEDVPGHGRLAQRRAEFARVMAEPALRAARVAPDLLSALASMKITREPMADQGLWFIRRLRERGHDYFVLNPTGKTVDAWVRLGTPASRALLLDPLSGESGLAASRQRAGRSEVYLQLASGQSLLLRTGTNRSSPDRWRYFRPHADARELAGPWQVEFLRGGPELPAPVTLGELRSWTQTSAAAVSFSGTARYRLEFDAPAQRADDWLLDLGDVRESARVTLNGSVLGTVWSLPARLRLGELRTHNVLEIEVTNLPANRIRDLDRRKADWKIMKDINLASLRYRQLDAATWEPAPSGLLGPVRLVPLRNLQPQAAGPQLASSAARAL
jgi:hypothetical protein